MQDIQDSLVAKATKVLQDVLLTHGFEARSLQDVTLTERTLTNGDLYVVYTFKHIRTGAVFIAYSASGNKTPPWSNLRNKINYPLTPRSGLKQKEIIAQIEELGLLYEITGNVGKTKHKKLPIGDVRAFWGLWDMTKEISFEDAKQEYASLVKHYRRRVLCLNATDKLSSNKNTADRKKPIFNLNAIIRFEQSKKLP